VQTPDGTKGFLFFGFSGSSASADVSSPSQKETMRTSAYYPYRSEAARDFCFAYFDSLAAREWPIASEERTVPTMYGATFLRISGPSGAPPLVLLPGAATTSLMWAPNIQALSAEYQTFAVDQIGDFGRSICTKPLRLKDLLPWLNELFDALGLRGGLNLVGVSSGGALVAQYALHFPERLNRVVLLAPAATVLRLRTEFLVRLTLAAIARRRCLPSLVRWIFADMARKDPKSLDATLEQLLINMRNLQRRYIQAPPVLTDAEWRSLRMPALFLAGEHEVIYSAKRAVHRLKRVAPQVSVEIIPDAGHDLTFVQAAMVNQRILEFLKQEPAASEKFGAFACVTP